MLSWTLLLLAGCMPPGQLTIGSSASIPPPTATAVPSPAPSPTPDVLEYTPEFMPAPCEFRIPEYLTSAPPGEQPEVECGFLIVPENRQEPHPFNIRLHVAIFHSSSSSQADDPVVYLAGGPGGNALDSIGRYYDQIFAEFLGSRDLIVFDQRGTGFSQPSLACPRFEEAVVRLHWKLLDPEEGREILLAGVDECRLFLERKGIDLSAYNSQENAADVNDLRVALGYDNWNLFGVSYGTKLALTVMRAYPDGVRRVILDSTYPLEVGLYSSFPENTSRALEALFAGCDADPACSAAYPDLRGVFFETVARLDAQPVSLQIPDVFNRHPADLFLPEAERVEFILRGGGLMQFVFSSMYSNASIPLLPHTIYEVSRGDYSALEGQLIYLIPEDVSVSWGMHYTVQCREEVPFESPEALSQAVLNFPETAPMLRNSETGQLVFEICAGFEIPAAAESANHAVASDIPTLVIAGGYDPITPPAWGESVAGGLSEARYVFVGASGHGVVFQNACAMGVARAFLDDVRFESAARCLDQIPPFVFRVPVSSVELAAFSDPGPGLAGVYPQGWRRLEAGTYAWFDLILLQFFFSNPEGRSIAEVAEDIRGSLVISYGVNSEADLIDTRLARGRPWSIYEMSSLNEVFFMALAADHQQILIIILNAPGSDREILYNEVLLPAIDAFDVLTGQ